MKQLEKVMKQIDDNWEEQLSFLQKIGKSPSELGSEKEVQGYIRHKYEELGLDVDVFEPDYDEIAKIKGAGISEWSYEDRPIVVGKWETDEGGKGNSLILQGHIDVVSPEPIQQWKHDPWGAVIEKDKMYGRGICDMKSGVSAYVYAVQAIKDAGIKLDADLYLQSVYEEEVTDNGAIATIARGYRADAALIPEPLEPKAVIAQIGVVLMRVRVKAEGSHVLGATEAVNPIDKAYKLIEGLYRYQEKVNYKQPKHEAFESYEQPLNVSVGVIRGGDSALSVPAECMFEVRIGFNPDQDPEEIKKEVQHCLEEVSNEDSWLKDTPPEIAFYGHNAPGFYLNKDQQIFKTLERAHNRVHEDTMEYHSVAATTDAAIYNLHGIPATCYGPVGENMHAPNESVDLDSVKEVTKVYAAFVLEWCGVKE